MKSGIINRIKNSIFRGDYVGRDQYITNIIMFRDNEREFVVTHNADIKPVSYFTGRETELEDLRQRIENGQKSVLVSGMGGIGKTHICRKLFEEYLNKYAKNGNGPFHHIGYIEYAGDMNSSLMNCLKYKEQDDSKQNQEAAWKELEHLAADGKLLLFVDNVDKPVNADSGLQRLKEIPGAVILTSRQASFSDEFEPYPIGFLDMVQCKEIYEKIRFKGSGRKVRLEEEQDLKYVIEDLAGRHTITVELLAHLAQTKTWTVKRLREELEQKGFCLTFHKNGELVNIQESYEALYDLSELTEAEQNILEAFSVFPYIPLAAETCNEWLLADASVSENDDVLMGLYQKGWLQFDIDQECYVLHPVFAQFIYEKCKPKIKRHYGLVEACQKSIEGIQSDVFMECLRYIPFAENIIAELEVKNDFEQVDFIASTASLLFYMAEYKKAEDLCERVLGICEKVLGEEHPDTVTNYNNLAVVYYSQGEYEKAEELYKKNLDICERVLGEGHPNMAAIYDNLGSIYYSQGEYEKAEELCQKSLEICEKVHGEEHPNTATIYDNLGSIYYSRGEYEKAEELHQKGLEIRERVLGENHPDTAYSYYNLSYLYKGRGEYEKAKELCKKSLGIRERVLGENHPNMVTGYHHLAEVYVKQGEYEKAKELYQKSLEICEKVLGEEHPDTVTNYNNLAVVYYSQGEYEKAEKLYKKSLEIRKRVLGENHPDIANSYNNLAELYDSQGEYEKAIIYLLKAYKIFVFKRGLNYPTTIIVYLNMEITYSKLNPDGNFEQWLEEQMKE